MSFMQSHNDTMYRMMGWKCVPTHLSYGPRYRQQRRWMQDLLISKEALATYHPMQRRETYILLQGLLDAPNAFVNHVHRYAGFMTGRRTADMRMHRHSAALMIEIVYGHKVTGFDDEYVKIAERASTETIAAGSPGSSVLSLLVDFFPIRMCSSIFLNAILIQGSATLPAVASGFWFQGQDK